MSRVYNFSAGPATLPEDVLKTAQQEMLNYQDSGMSVMEMSHRSKVYMSIFEGAKQSLREVMGVPQNYEILFLQGGATMQFSMIPLNLLSGSGKADYIHTGQWSKKAIAEAKRFGDIKVVASSEDQTFNYIPEIDPQSLRKDADYLHITTNNTIYGTHFKSLPDSGDVPLVADMSSHILSEPMNVSDYALIYAGAQKNIGPAGVTVVIIRKDLLERAPLEHTPALLNYKSHADNGSMLNTPPCYSVYIAGLVFEWIKSQGGVNDVYQKNLKKAQLLYDALDASQLFKGTVRAEDRSLMNVPFVLPSDQLNDEFLSGAAERGLLNLKGHRTVGGMRASIYNAMPIEGVEALVSYIQEFEAKH